MDSTGGKKITFFSRDAMECPVCGTSFHKEELLSGSGRLIAGNVTDELRRLYEPSKRYGEINPLIYPITVCPVCYYASFPRDFLQLSSQREAIDILRREKRKRASQIGLLFKKLDFTAPRNLEEGAASYALAMMCYEHFDRTFAPTIKQGIATLRAAWMFADLHRKHPNENFDYVMRLFYRKSRFFYQQSIEKEQSGDESMGTAGHLGPDTDKNYGYDGVLYLAALMEYKYGPKNDPEARADHLDRAKKIVSRVHGMGKASKAKPSMILDKVKDLFHTMSEEANRLRGVETEA
jgi:uncharacterized protein (DUF2225 family)